MLIRIGILISVVIISLLFKYYIFKLELFKENLFEGIDTNINTNINVDNANVNAGDVTSLGDEVKFTEEKIKVLNEEITRISADLENNTITNEQKTELLKQLAETMNTLNNRYTELDTLYKQLLENKRKEREKQQSTLKDASKTQAENDELIYKMDMAEKEAGRISQEMSTLAQTTRELVKTAYTSHIPNGNIDLVNVTTNQVQTNYNKIVKNETKIKENVTIAKTDVANTMLKWFNGSKESMIQLKIYADNSIPIVQNIANAKHNLSILMSANAQGKNAVVSAINSQNINETRAATNNAKDALIKGKAAYAEIMNKISKVETANDFKEPLTFMDSAYDIKDQANRFLTELNKAVIDAEDANRNLQNAIDAIQNAKDAAEAQEKKRREQAAADAANAANAKAQAVYDSIGDLPIQKGLVMYFKMNGLNGPRVVNEASQEPELDTHRNIWAKAKINANYVKFGQNSLDCTGKEDGHGYGGYAAITKSYNFNSGCAVMFWIYHQTRYGYDRGILFMCNDPNYDNCISMMFDDQDLNNHTARISVMVCNGGNQFKTTGNTRLQPNTWNHIQMIMHSDKQSCYLVINGVYDNPSSSRGGLPLPDMSRISLIYVGASYTPNANHGSCKAFIDDFAAYNRNISYDETIAMYKYSPVGHARNLDLMHSLCYDSNNYLYSTTPGVVKGYANSNNKNPDGNPDGGGQKINIRPQGNNSYLCTNPNGPWARLARCPEGSTLSADRTQCIRQKADQELIENTSAINRCKFSNTTGPDYSTAGSITCPSFQRTCANFIEGRQWGNCV